MEQREAPRSRRRTRNEPRLGARKRRRRRRTVDRARPDPSRGGLGGDGAGRGPRRAGRRPPLRHAVRRTGMRVLGTGGRGLVGSHVIEARRARGEPVRALVRPASRAVIERLGAEAVPGDVRDAAVWHAAAHGVRGLVHAAALLQQRASWREYEAVNVGGTRLAALAALAAGARLVHISSVAVYGGLANYRPESERRTEDCPFQPIPEHDFYARSKRLAEAAVREAAEGGLTAVALRPNVIYGERDRLFTPRVIRVLRRRVVPRIGPGTNHLSCVYAGNIAAAVVTALDAPVSGFRAYNVTSDAPPVPTQHEFLASFAAALGVRPVTIPIPTGLARGVMTLLTSRRLARAATAFITGENPYVDEPARRELVDVGVHPGDERDRKSTRRNSSHGYTSYAVFCLKKKTASSRTLTAERVAGREAESFWHTTTTPKHSLGRRSADRGDEQSVGVRASPFQLACLLSG